jgi:tetratricopeptide (TPR) repeat protein
MKAKNIIYLLSLLCLIHNSAPAQELVYDTIPVDESVKCTLGETDACVTIIADKSLDLGFRSTNEKIEDFMSNKENIGSQTHYYLHFKTVMPNNMDRKLEIFTKINPNPLMIDMSYLLPKSTLILSVRALLCYDPVFREANTLFLAGQYQAARDKYVKTRDCFDAPPPSENDIEQKIIQIDSIIVWIERADESMLLLDYNDAVTYYWKVVSINPFDQHTVSKRDIALKKQLEHCSKCQATADKYYMEHEYDNALAIYQRAMDQNCSAGAESEARIEEVKKIIDSHKNKYQVFTYEFGTGKSDNPGLSSLQLPISFSTGKYMDYKWAGYFSFASNPAFFNMLRSDYSKAVQSDIGISFGLNFRPVKPDQTKYVPVWFFFGTGYTFMGAYHYSDASGEEVRYEGGDLPETELKRVPYHAIPFEAGLLLKIKWLALRYTFQYRFATKLDTREYMNPFVNSFGVGLCF